MKLFWGSHRRKAFDSVLCVNVEVTARSFTMTNRDTVTILIFNFLPFPKLPYTATVQFFSFSLTHSSVCTKRLPCSARTRPLQFPSVWPSTLPVCSALNRSSLCLLPHDVTSQLHIYWKIVSFSSLSYLVLQLESVYCKCNHHTDDAYKR